MTVAQKAKKPTRATSKRGQNSKKIAHGPLKGVGRRTVAGQKLEVVVRGFAKIREDQVADVLAELLALEKDNDKLTAEAIVKRAKKKGSKLYDLFEWDDSAAAIKYRKQQSRMLLASFALVPVGETDPRGALPFFVAVRTVKPPTDEKGKDVKGRAYVNISKAARNSWMLADMIETGRRRLDSFRVRYGHIEKFAPVLDAIEILELDENKNGGKS